MPKHRIQLLLLLFAFAVLPIGCKTPEEYKADADAKVYEIIDQKWQDDFGPKTNYKISDTPPAPGSIDPAQSLPASGPLTLAQAVTIATANNRWYQLEKEVLYLTALDLTLIRHQFEPRFFGRADTAYTRSEGEELWAADAEFGFDQLLADGAFITTSVGAAWLDVMSGDLRGGLTSILGATVTQPLMRGAGRRIVQEPLTQAQRNTLYQLRSFGRFRKTFVVDVITQYYLVLQSCDALKNTENNYDTLVKLYGHAEKLADSGRLPLFELDQARQDKLQARDIYLSAQEQYDQLLDEFKLTLALPTNIELSLDPNELGALTTTRITRTDFTEDDVITAALAGRLDLANAYDTVDDARRKVEVAADMLRAELNLVAGAGATSEPGTDLNKLERQSGSGEIGLQADLPLDRVAEQNAYRQALITLQQSKRQSQEAKDIVILQVRQAWRELTEAADRHKVQTQALALARKRFDNTRSLLGYGRANTRDVLDAQEDLFDAQNAATEELVKYTIAMLSFYRDTGVLQVRPDGFWQQNLISRNN